MLTPCFVTTLHSGPAFFSHLSDSKDFETVENFIDLLIVDEAGQTMPAIAGAMVSTAKRALFVGDSKQIEPIFSLTESIDLANAKKFSFCKNVDDYNSLKDSGILCSGDPQTMHAYGNLILLGQRLAKYHLKDYKVPGILLTEHRRCAKEIISYCNELCYDNQLIPLTKEEDCPYPRMGYAHIKGKIDREGTSRSNSLEAEAIADWIKRNRETILETCQEETLAKCVSIITPFRKQAYIIRCKLKQVGITDIDRVGTIHSLQGAQKPIIIFSPVYCMDEKSQNYFFDRSANMLNVAVSRAQRAFLVFGDMDIFDRSRGNQPSALLAKYLFGAEDNEIKDIIQPRFKAIPLNKNDFIEHISTLKRHREILTATFPRAKQELNIVSPFLRRKAIEADGIIDLIKQNVDKKEITIYTDIGLNEKYREFRQVVDMLCRAGAKVVLVKNAHSKILTIDERVIVEGSFNWLSASRTDRKYIYQENSMLYSGESDQVKQFIREALQPIKQRMIQ